MKENPIISLAREKAEQPNQLLVQRAVNPVYGHCLLGEIRAVASIAILNGEQTYTAAYAGLTRADRLQLVGLLEEMKAALLEHQDQPFIERLPSK